MPPVVKSKSAAKDGGPKSKPAAKSASSTPGTATPAEPADAPPSIGGFSKPDKAAYDLEQDTLRKEIDAKQARLVCFLLLITAAFRCSRAPPNLSS
jgi:hypothetical protein